MKKPWLADGDRRALRLGALAAAPILLWAFGMKPYTNHVAGHRSAIERERAVLAREHMLIASATAYRARFLEARTRIDAQRPRRFVAPDPASATALLATYVSDLAYDSDVRVDRATARQPELGDAGTELHVGVDATADVVGLARWLVALENGAHAVIVERLEVRSSVDAFGAPPEYGEPPPQWSQEPLRISVDVVGFAAAGAGSESSGVATSP